MNLNCRKAFNKVSHYSLIEEIEMSRERERQRLNSHSLNDLAKESKLMHFICIGEVFSAI